MNRPWRIGENMPRREDVPLLRGETEFFAARRSMAQAVMLVLRSPVACGGIVNLDVAAALAVPGVLMVLTAKDLVQNGPLPCVDVAAASSPAFQTVLACDDVQYVGQPIAAVVASAPGAALAGLAAFDLDITPRPPMLLLEMAKEVHILNPAIGDPERFFADADLVVEGDFAFHRVSASPLELRGVEASVEGDPRRVTVRATTQIAVAARGYLASLVGLPQDQVAYEPLRLGGSFGLKEAFYPEEVLVATAALRLGLTVRWEETRFEHFVGSTHARQGRAHVRMALTREGEVTALNVDGRLDIGAGYSYVGNSPGAVLGAMIRGPYRIPHFAGRTASVITNKTPLNVYRGAGHPQAVFAMERMMDKAARALAMDRIEIRRRNLIPPDAFPHVRGTPDPGPGGKPIVYDSGDFERCLDEALDAIGADDFAGRRAVHQTSHATERLGLGVSLMVELTSTGPDETVALEVGRDGRVTVFSAPVEMGQRADSALAQVLSAALGIAPEDVEIRCGDNKDLPSGGGAYGSRGAAVCGAAVAAAAERLKAEAIGLAAEIEGLPQEALSWSEGGVVGCPRRNAPLRLAELLDRAPTGTERRLAVTGTFKVPAASCASAAHAVVVAVDIETGVIRVLDYAVAHDCGVILNPRGVDGQIIGGVMQGIGAVLNENLPYAEDGTPLARRLMDYPLPVAADVPRFHLRHVETPSPLNPLGLKGAGEGGFTGAPAALVSAIEDALSEFGLQLDDDGPYPPSRVLALIRDAAVARPPSENAGETSP
jgi:CO/xanthine dehydrogenase Mo-binding subunit